MDRGQTPDSQKDSRPVPASLANGQFSPEAQYEGNDRFASVDSRTNTGPAYSTDKMNEAQKAQIEAIQNIGSSVLVIIFALSLLSSVLLLLAGIGYLKQKKFLGRTIGNTYAVISIVSSVVSGIMFASELGGGFNIGTIIGLIYPVLTLILLNTTFGEALAN